MTHSDYLLSADEVERFDATFEGNPFTSELLEDSATAWRRNFRALHPTPEACRWAFLYSMIGRMSSKNPHLSRMEDLPSLSRYLCMRVEQRVAELDAAE